MPLLLVVALACSRRIVVSESAVPELLRIADNQWERRGALGLDVVEGTLAEAYRDEPDDPEVLWRLVRLNVARGIAETDARAALYAFAEARALGVTCLDRDLAFLQQRTAMGWPAAVPLLTQADGACAAWTALAWARWIDLHGPVAAALDFVALEALVSRASEVSTDDAREVAVWADGMVAAMRPPWDGGDLERGRVLLGRAVRVRPDELWRRVDVIRLVAVPSEDADLARVQVDAILAAPADTPENVAAQAFAEAWSAPR